MILTACVISKRKQCRRIRNGVLNKNIFKKAARELASIERIYGITPLSQTTKTENSSNKNTTTKLGGWPIELQLENI